MTQARWGGDWRMPTQQDLNDLYDNCDWTWTTTNGVSGYVVRGRGNYASNRIFLPCAGYGSGTSLNNTGSDGYYWSSVPLEGNTANAKYLSAYPGNCEMDDISRSYGQSVRPVWPPLDLSALTADYTAEDGDILTGATAYSVSVPAGATVIVNGVR